MIIHILNWDSGETFSDKGTFCGIDGRPYGWPHDAWWVPRKDVAKANCWRCFRALRGKGA